MVFDVVFAVQHYVLYPASGRGAHGGGAAEGSGEEDSESLLDASAAVNGSKDNPRSP